MTEENKPTAQYYTTEDVLATSFIMFSKALIFGKKYREKAEHTTKDGKVTTFEMLSIDARFLYGIYQDRYSMSVTNLKSGSQRFVDAKRRVFCYFTNDEVRFYTGWGLPKISRIKKELAAYDLMCEETQGTNKANRIYILKVPGDLEIFTVNDFKVSHEESEKIRKAKRAEKKEKELSILENSGNTESELPLDGGSFRNEITGNTDSKLPVIPNQNASNIKENNTKENNKELVLEDPQNPLTGISEKSTETGQYFSDKPPERTSSSKQETKTSYLPPEQYKLLEKIAERYHFLTGYRLTHEQKMKIGSYALFVDLEELAFNQEQLGKFDIMTEVADAAHPFAYLVKCLENRKEEYRALAHTQARAHYSQKENIKHSEEQKVG